MRRLVLSLPSRSVPSASVFPMAIAAAPKAPMARPACRVIPASGLIALRSRQIASRDDLMALRKSALFPVIEMWTTPAE